LKFNKSKPLYISSVYRPPARGKDIIEVEKLRKDLDSCLSKLPNKAEIFILGDFNCNFNKSYTLSSIIKELCNARNLKQLVQEPTRVTSTSMLYVITTRSIWGWCRELLTIREIT